MECIPTLILNKFIVIVDGLTIIHKKVFPDYKFIVFVVIHLMLSYKSIRS